MEPFFVPHGDHAHAVQSALLPAVAAPLVSEFGLRGAYLIPGGAFLAMVPLLIIAQRRLGLSPAPALLGFIVVCASPLFFYSLEFWDHAPAAAALAGFTALAWGRNRAEEMCAGLCGAAAVLFRPEAIWFLIAAGPAMLWTGRRGKAVMVAGLSAAAGLCFAMAANYVHSGSLLGTHWETNLTALSYEWLARRAQMAAVWFVPPLAGALGIAVIGAAWLLKWARRMQLAFATGLLGAVLLAVIAATGIVPRESFWQSSAVIGLALMPLPRTSNTTALYILLIGCIAGVFLTAPNDGGAQWGPRYLLIATPALLLLATEAASIAFTRDRLARLAHVVPVIIILLCSIAVTRLAYRELRGSKRHYAQLVDHLDRARNGTNTIVTDIWWLDQIAAPLYGRVTFLFVQSESSGWELASRLQGAGVRSFLVAASPESPVFRGTPSWFKGSCFVPQRTTTLAERQLMIYRAECILE